MHEIHLAGKVIWRKKYFRVYSKRDRLCEKMVYISPHISISQNSRIYDKSLIHLYTDISC